MLAVSAPRRDRRSSGGRGPEDAGLAALHAVGLRLFYRRLAGNGAVIGALPFGHFGVLDGLAVDRPGIAGHRAVRRHSPGSCQAAFC